MLETSRSVPTTADLLVVTGPGLLFGALLCAGADAASVAIRDGIDASGTIIAKLGAGIGQSAPFAPVAPVAFKVGLFVDVLTGTTPQVNVLI